MTRPLARDRRWVATDPSSPAIASRSRVAIDDEPVPGQERGHGLRCPCRAPRLRRQRIVDPEDSLDGPGQPTSEPGRPRAFLVVDDEHAPPRRTGGEGGDGRLDGLLAQVGDDALPHPRRTRRRVVSRGGQSWSERIAGEIDRHERQPPDGRFERGAAIEEIGLRGRVVDGEHGGFAQLRHPPRPAVEARSDDDDLALAGGPDRIVDEHRAGHHDLGAGPDRFEGQSLAPRTRVEVLADLLDRHPFVRAQEEHGNRVVEPPGGDPPVGDGPALAHQHRRSAGSVGVHRAIVTAGRSRRLLNAECYVRDASISPSASTSSASLNGLAKNRSAPARVAAARSSTLLRALTMRMGPS